MGIFFYNKAKNNKNDMKTLEEASPSCKQLFKMKPTELPREIIENSSFVFSSSDVNRYEKVPGIPQDSSNITKKTEMSLIVGKQRNGSSSDRISHS